MASITVPIAEAKESLAELVEQALQGETIFLGEEEQPLVRLVPTAVPSRKRIPGLNRGEIWMSDDFDEPLPDEFWLGES